MASRNSVQKVTKINLSSPSACLFLLPQPVWGADTACGRSGWTNRGRCLEITWFSVGPSTAAPRAPRPSPMMPPSIALFPVENIWGIVCLFQISWQLFSQRTFVSGELELLPGSLMSLVWAKAGEARRATIKTKQVPAIIEICKHQKHHIVLD